MKSSPPTSDDKGTVIRMTLGGTSVKSRTAGGGEPRLENGVEISEEMSMSMVMTKDGNFSSARVGSGAGQMKEQLQNWECWTMERRGTWRASTQIV